MVYKPLPNLKSPIRAACEKIPSKKRPISIGASVEQRPWKPTIRKGCISNEPIPGRPAFETMPPLLGPNVINSNKKSAPAFSMGRQIKLRPNIVKDGPKAQWPFNIAGLTNKGVHRAPAFSLKNRKDGIQNFQAPAANRYRIDKAIKATTKTIPTFSFGKKPHAMKVITTPAPNVYNLPPVFGTAKEAQIKAAPAFTMLGRTKPRQIPTFKTPGPGEYENNYRYLQKISPRFSLHTKHKAITDDHMKPGPGAHCPERYIRHKSVPAPSFSIHHTPYLAVRKAYVIPECKIASKPEWIL